MISLAQNFKKVIPFITDAFTQSWAPEVGLRVEPPSFDILKEKKQILREMEFSRNTGNLVGVYSKRIGEGMFLVGVQDIIRNEADDFTIVFHPFDMSGHPLVQPAISLREICMIVPFNNPYRKPNEILA